MNCWLKDYSVKGTTHLLWPLISPYSIRHFQEIKDWDSPWKKGAHLVVGTLQAIPIIGQAASGLEWLAHRIFSYNQQNPSYVHLLKDALNLDQTTTATDSNKTVEPPFQPLPFKGSDMAPVQMRLKFTRGREGLQMAVQPSTDSEITGKPKELSIGWNHQGTVFTLMKPLIGEEVDNLEATLTDQKFIICYKEDTKILTCQFDRKEVFGEKTNEEIASYLKYNLKVQTSGKEGKYLIRFAMTPSIKETAPVQMRLKFTPAGEGLQMTVQSSTPELPVRESGKAELTPNLTRFELSSYLTREEVTGLEVSLTEEKIIFRYKRDTEMITYQLDRKAVFGNKSNKDIANDLKYKLKVKTTEKGNQFRICYE